MDSKDRAIKNLRESLFLALGALKAYCDTDDEEMKDLILTLEDTLDNEDYDMEPVMALG